MFRPRRGFLVCASALLSALLVLVACSLPGEVVVVPTPDAAPTPVEQPDHCRGGGAVQTWMLAAEQPPESELMTAYRSPQIIEFQASVAGQDDDPAKLPRRSFVLSEVAEGITLTLDYTGDPPPIMLGQRYRFVAWAGEAAGPPSFELQVFDEQGLLFLGATNVDLMDDPLDIILEGAEGDCPLIAATRTPAGAESASGMPSMEAATCTVERQVQPLRVQWGEQAVTLYPGEDGELAHAGNLFQVSVFRSRLVRPMAGAGEDRDGGEQILDPCAEQPHHERSVRIQRVFPPPLPPILPPEAITATAPITARFPVTPLFPITSTVPVTPGTVPND